MKMQGPDHAWMLAVRKWSQREGEMSQHTPGPCDCWVTPTYFIRYCPVHEVAREMLEAVKALLLIAPDGAIPQAARALLAKVEGK